MRAWGSCAVSVLASASHSARAFVPAAGFRDAPLLSRGLRRPLHSSSSSSSCSRVAQPQGLWVVHRRGGEPAAGIWQQGGRVRLLRSMASSSSSSSSGGSVQEAEVEPAAQEEWSVTKVRQTFIDYFESKREHTPYPSSPVVPVNDPSLLFANAGMNQFKPIFLGQTDPSSPLAGLKRAVNSQKCIRAGGKHNDLDDVGKDVYHHTFFEMLGTWSFGDYFKEEAVEWGFDALTGQDVYGLASERLYATYFGGDEGLGLPPDLETRDLWLKVLPAERVLPFGRKDNFWEMGDVGPCGPCSELHYDRIGGRDAAGLVNQDDPDVIEIWNLVFMQFNRDEGGNLKLLPAKHVDTGLGLERLVSILQGKRSNYDTDVFGPLFDAVQEVTGCPPYEGRVGAEDADLKDTAYRVVADHARALTFAITDGAVPANDGRGYVLRRILRRAVRYGQDVLGAPPGFFQKLVPVVVAEFGDAYPELRAKEGFVAEIIKEEEEAFSSMLERGIRHFKEVEEEQRSKSSKTIPGETAFFLYDSMGFPLDLTQVMAEEVGMTVDEDGFAEEMAAQKARSKEAEAARRAAGAGVRAMALGADETSRLAEEGIKPTDDDAKYTWTPSTGSKIMAMFDGQTLATSASQGCGTATASPSEEDATTVGIILDSTAFYSEAGGQVSDCGKLLISGDDGDSVAGVVEVADVRMFGGFALHVGRLVSGSLGVGDSVTCEVDYARRGRVAPNHTMTHALNYALRQAVGEGVDQKGSLVTDEKLRFDFSHGKALTGPQLEESEAIVQKIIEEERPVYNQVLPLSEARSIFGLRAVFGEVYPDPVRVVSVGFPVEDMAKDPSREEWATSSVEFCGGTHVSNTREAEAFVITEETAVAKGIRRITAITGAAAKEAVTAGEALRRKGDEVSALEGGELEAAVAVFRRDVDGTVLSAAVKGRLRATGEKLLKRVASESKAKAAAAAQSGVDAAVKGAKEAVEKGQSSLVMEVAIGADSKAVKRVLDGVSKVAPGLSFMGFSPEGPNASGKLLVFSTVAGAAAEDGLKADEWLRAALDACGGRGGGRATSAQGQAADAGEMDKGMAAAEAFLTG
eukprot:g16580.t1